MTGTPTTLPSRVTLSLSNQCPRAAIHKACPASRTTTVEVLPTTIVSDVITTLRRWKYRAAIAWHVYNEPLADPRALHLTAYAREQLPDSPIILWTSGWQLTDTIARDMISAGVTHLYITAYGPAERKRLQAVADGLSGVVKTKLFNGKLDARLVQTPVARDNWQACSAPLSDLTIWPDGSLGLCCMDWAREQCFGNLHAVPFAQLYEAQLATMLEWQRSLRNKQRRLTVCRACQHERN